MRRRERRRKLESSDFDWLAVWTKRIVSNSLQKTLEQPMRCLIIRSEKTSRRITSQRLRASRKSLTNIIL